MRPSLLVRCGRPAPSQEAEVTVVLHLLHEPRERLDGARQIVEVDHLIGRIGVPSRYPDADGGDAVAAQMNRGGLRGATCKMRGELYGNPLGVGGLQKIPL